MAEKKRTKVLLVGGSGFLGSYVGQMLRKSFADSVDVTATHRMAPPPTWDGGPKMIHLDLCDAASIAACIKSTLPDAVVLIGGARGSEYNSKPDNARRTNLVGPSLLLDSLDQICGKNKYSFIFYSTELVYKSSNDCIVESTGTIYPLGQYAKDKLAVEKLLSSRVSNLCILRGSFHYGKRLHTRHGEGFMTKVLAQLKAQEKVYAFVDEMRSPCYIEDAAAIVCLALQRCVMCQRSATQMPQRIFHITSGEMISRYNFVLQVCRQAGLDDTLVIPVKSTAFDFGVPRPRRLDLSNKAVTDYLGAPQTKVVDGIARSLDAADKAATKLAALAPATVKVAFRPRNILLTGGAGFIGSHVVIRLVETYKEYRVVVLDKLDYCATLNNLKSVSHLPNFKFIKGDITNSDLVNYVIKTEEIDTIMHFAAQTHVDNSFGNSFSFTQTNVFGTHVLLEAARVHCVKRFIHVSTDEVYGEGEESSVKGAESTEDSRLEPTNPYAATKAAAEFLAKSYLRSFRVPIIITRGNNVYGPHQFPEKIIPKFTRLLMRGEPCPLHGSGRNARNYLYVTDVAAAFDTILHKGVVGEIYNVGTEKEVSNEEVACDLIGLFGFSPKTHMRYVNDRPFNDLRYNIKSTKLHALGWSPKIDWQQGLRTTVAWYKENESHWGVSDMSTVLVAHPRHQ